jgi:hypothetical protein
MTNIILVIHELQREFHKKHMKEANVIILGHNQLAELHGLIDGAHLKFYDPALLFQTEGKDVTVCGMYIDFLIDADGHLKMDGLKLKHVPLLELGERRKDNPPLGLRPRFVSDRNRAQEIIAAVWRYNIAGKEVPAEWHQEFKDLEQRNTPEDWEWIKSQLADDRVDWGVAGGI